MVRAIAIVIVFLGLPASTSQAQQVTGNLEGRILDAQEKPLAEVSIVMQGPALQGQRGATSDDRGYFRVLVLPVGSYTVKLSHIAHHAATYENVPIRLGKTTTLGEVRLQSREMQMAEIVVSGERPVIDPTSTTIGENLRAESYNQLPVDRNFRSIATLIPQANATFYGDEANISGSTGTENIYVIDGMNVTDPVGGFGSTNLPYNFVQEIEIKTGGYEAEYGRALGGIINVITPSGGNDFHGQLFGFFTNQGFGGERRPGLEGAKVGDFSEYDAGLSLHGPLVRDQLWFFAAYNPNHAQEDIEIPGLGTYPDRKTSHLFAGKLTWQARENTNLVFTLFGDPSTHHEVYSNPIVFGGPVQIENADVLLDIVEEGSINTSLQMRQTVSRNFLLEASISRLDQRHKFQPETERGRSEPSFRNLVNGLWSGGIGYVADDKSSRTAAKLGASLFIGKHALKAGLEYEDNLYDQSTYNSVNPGGILRVAAAAYTTFYSAWRGKVHNRVPSVFVQDAWQITKRFGINAGLRWDGQYFVGSDGNVAQTITDQFQPRVGFTYQLGALGSRKLFGSYGRFYEQVPTLFSGIYHINLIQFFVNYDHDPRLDPTGGDSTSFSQVVSPEVNGLRGQHFDEFVLGYEQQLWDQFKVGVRGLYRNLREVIEDGIDPANGVYLFGNPGKGNFSFFPRFEREYRAAELTVQTAGGRKYDFLASYVWSKNHGNYVGLYNADAGGGFPNANSLPDIVEQIPHSNGSLPNERTHVFKFSGSYRFNFGLIAGTSMIWQSGTPLSEFGAGSFGPFFPIFLRQRGSAGRTPAIADLNIRLKYDLAKLTKTSLKPKLVLDAFHVFNQRKPVTYDQTHYFAMDENGNQTSPNENYGKPTRYHPPRTVRLGMEVEF